MVFRVINKIFVHVVEYASLPPKMCRKALENKMYVDFHFPKFSRDLLPTTQIS